MHGNKETNLDSKSKAPRRNHPEIARRASADAALVLDEGARRVHALDRASFTTSSLASLILTFDFENGCRSGF